MTWQLADAPVPVSVHIAPGVKVTWPVGVAGLGEVSMTITVQVTVVWIGRDAVVQETVVVVGWIRGAAWTVRVKVTVSSIGVRPFGEPLTVMV